MPWHKTYTIILPTVFNTDVVPTEAFVDPPVYTTYDMELSHTKPGDVMRVPSGKQVVWSSRTFGLSLCSVFCCGFFGIIATAMSIIAYVDSKVCGSLLNAI